jgi:uncharacterized membrane protein
MTPLAKRLWIALAVSIAVNVLLAGIWVGRAFRHPREPRGEREKPALHAERDGRRGPLRGLYREHGDELREKRRAIGDARRSAREALEKEPFARADLENALAALRKETGSSQEIMHRALVDAAEKGSPEERKKLGKALERFGVGAGPGPGGERGPGHPPKHE